MVALSQGLWNTLFSWMSTKQCMLPEGCDVPLSGVGVYVAVVVFVAVMVYWFRTDIRQAAYYVYEHLPLPF